MILEPVDGLSRSVFQFITRLLGARGILKLGCHIWHNCIQLPEADCAIYSTTAVIGLIMKHFCLYIFYIEIIPPQLYNWKFLLLPGGPHYHH